MRFAPICRIQCATAVKTLARPSRSSPTGRQSTARYRAKRHFGLSRAVATPEWLLRLGALVAFTLATEGVMALLHGDDLWCPTSCGGERPRSSRAGRCHGAN